jgi:peptidoglycan/xylan/chitin deacetylase (PgdA/CDA1 family)
MRRLGPAPVAAAAALLLALPAQGVTGRHGNRLRPVPILMYHVISSPPPGAAYPDLYVPRSDFAAEVRWLAAHGYQAVTLQRVFDAWRGAAALPAKPVVLSFDDGYRSQVTNALPALKARHWPGVLNLEVRNLQPVWGIRPPGVRKLLAAGWELDAHTLTHPDLTTVDPVRLRDEVAGSRAAIRKRFHVSVNFFCYPAGRYNDAVIAAVQQAGYLGATTTRYGLAQPSELYTLARVRVSGTDGASGLAAKLGALSR